MKTLPVLVALIGLGSMLHKPESEPYVLILGGDTDGYLSPCGCTKPMTGGIRRRATAIRTLSVPGRTIVLENGGLISDNGRQDELKAETLAQVLAAVNATAINLTRPEAQAGQGLTLAIQQLSDERFISSNLKPSETNRMSQFKAAGPFLIGGCVVSPSDLAAPLLEEAIPTEQAVEYLITEAEAQDRVPILMLHGSRSDAEALAKSFPEVALIQYRSGGDPSNEPRRVGKTWLVSPGEKGKYVLRLTFKNGCFDNYQAVELTPDFEDDPKASSYYEHYLMRVDEEDLLEQLSRRDTEAYVGNQACGSCHQGALRVWKDSKHSGALKTLEDDRHDRDPDCVECHVVGLDSYQGFLSRMETPELANVGCESCHGPGAKHSKNPLENLMGKVGEKSCAGCHVPQHSPGFDFSTYWPKIAH